MKEFAAVDPVLMPWAEARGLHVYTGHKQNVVRSLTVYVWQGARHDSLGHIWLDAPNWGSSVCTRRMARSASTKLLRPRNWRKPSMRRTSGSPNIINASRRKPQTSISPRI